jgi:hypothetical protein
VKYQSIWNIVALLSELSAQNLNYRETIANIKHTPKKPHRRSRPVDLVATSSRNWSWICEKW